MTTLAAGPFLDWEELTGQSKFIVDIISVPIFSAIAGLITNWTGVIMLFAPVRFTGFYVPGLKRIFPFLPRKVQILPTFAPNGILGFQGFIPCRAEKMASLIVDTSIARIGKISDFYTQLNPDKLAKAIAVAARPDIGRLTRDHRGPASADVALAPAAAERRGAADRRCRVADHFQAGLR